MLALAGACATGFARERDTVVAITQSVQFRSLGLTMRAVIFFVGGVAMIFLASAVQTFGTNWLGQVCPYPGPCFRPESLAIGLALAAYIAWKSVRSRR